MRNFLLSVRQIFSVSILTSSPLLTCHSGSATAEIWHHIDFSRSRPRSLNTTSGFVFVDVLAIRRSKSNNKPNFVDINGQHNYINLWLRNNDFWFGKTNVRHIGILLPVPISTIFSVICILLWISSKSEHPLQTYNVISLYQDGGRGRWILFPFLHLMISLPSEGQSLWANQISSTYLNWWLRFNYFRFWKKNVRHSGILLPVLISTTSRNFHVFLHHATEFRWNRSTHRRNMTSFPLWKWRPRPLNSSSSFIFVDVIAFKKSKSISKPNFVDISQLMAEI